MRTLQRNDKEHQKLRLQALREAEQAIADLHKLLDQPDQKRLSVGKMVDLAAQMGLLRPETQKNTDILIRVR